MPDQINVKPGAVLSFGELLLRITPDAGGEWLNNNQLPFYVGGAELNVATALALWGLGSRYLTALPQNGLTEQILNYLERKNIDTSAVYYNGNRLGLYFLTKGKDLKNDALIYDRAGSAFAALCPGMINWDAVFEGVSWFHFSAICPAISQNMADVCEEALIAASKKDITISVDLNYRARLWQYGKHPKDIMPALVQYCDLVMGNIWASEMMLGLPVIAGIHSIGLKSTYQQAALQTSGALMKQFPKCKAAANTFRFDADGAIKYYTTLYHNGVLNTSGEYTATAIVDKVGSGDCYMAGLIYGYCQHWPVAETLEFATAAAFEKLFVEGDATTRTVTAIKKAMLI